MIKYNFRFPSFTPAGLIAATGGITTGISLVAVIFPGTNRSSLITEIDFEGFGATSSPAEYGIFRSITSAAAGALTTVVTPQPTISIGTPPTFSGSAGQGSFATTQPTLAAGPLFTLAPNNNGQRYFWRANPNLDNAIDMPGTATALLNGLVLVQLAGSLNPIYGRIQLSEI